MDSLRAVSYDFRILNRVFQRAESMTIPPPPTLTRDQVRRVDQAATRRFGMSGLVLMENAGRGCADVLCELGIQGPVAICCGKGNNAGDGFVLARHLLLRGHAVDVFMWSDPRALTGDAAANYEILVRAGVRVEVQPPTQPLESVVERLSRADWIVDALLGTGAQGPPRPPLDLVIRHVNGLRARRMAVDLPSGLDCDLGTIADPTFRAACTCTFVAAKPGLRHPLAAPFVGQLRILDIGTPPAVLRYVLDSSPA
jgi:NAD(P)H-hydrate epimerase